MEYMFTPVRPAIIGFFIGAYSAIARGRLDFDGFHLEALLSFIALVAGSLYLVWLQREAHGVSAHLLYQTQLFTLWAGYATGWTWKSGYFFEDLWLVAAGWWLAASVVGALLIVIMGYRRQLGQPVSHD